MSVKRERSNSENRNIDVSEDVSFLPYVKTDRVCPYRSELTNGPSLIAAETQRCKLLSRLVYISHPPTSLKVVFVYGFHPVL